MKEYTVTLTTKRERIYNVRAYDEEEAIQTAFASDCDAGELIEERLLSHSISDGFSDVDAEPLDKEKD